MRLVLWIAAFLIGASILEEAIRSLRAPAAAPVPLTPLTYYPTYPSLPTFKGYVCTDDCSGHKAGYEWAEKNDVEDDSACDGNSTSFNEGCHAFVEQRP